MNQGSTRRGAWVRGARRRASARLASTCAVALTIAVGCAPDATPTDVCTPATCPAGDGPATLVVGERCGDTSVLVSNDLAVWLDTEGHTDDLAPACATAAGPDLFVQLDVTAGDRWKVLATPAGNGAATRDLVLELFPLVGNLCDTGTCDSTTVVDRFGVGLPEWRFFESATSMRLGVGVDDHAGFGGSNLRFARGRCGDAAPTNRLATALAQATDLEACDDGNRNGGDGCDAECRVELPAGTASEVEPNGDAWLGNRLGLAAAGGSATITGSLEPGATSVDAFTVVVDAGHGLQVRLRATAPTCETPSTLPVDLRVVATDGTDVPGGATITTDPSGCAVIDLPASVIATERVVCIARPTPNSAFPIGYSLLVDVL